MYISEEFKRFWAHICENVSLNSNDYRTIIEYWMATRPMSPMDLLNYRKDWITSNLYRAIKKLSSVGLLEQKKINETTVYCINEEYKKMDYVEKGEEFREFWNEICEVGRLSPNGYRIVIEFLIHDRAMSQKEFLDLKQDWKESSVSRTIRLIHSLGIFTCTVENGVIRYAVNPNFKAADSLKGKEKQNEIK